MKFKTLFLNNAYENGKTYEMDCSDLHLPTWLLQTFYEAQSVFGVGFNVFVYVAYKTIKNGNAISGQNWEKETRKHDNFNLRFCLREKWLKPLYEQRRSVMIDKYTDAEVAANTIERYFQQISVLVNKRIKAIEKEF